MRPFVSKITSRFGKSVGDSSDYGSYIKIVGVGNKLQWQLAQPAVDAGFTAIVERRRLSTYKNMLE
mgnify:CR=1 FL=1